MLGRLAILIGWVAVASMAGAAEKPTLWAWERPENLRFADDEADVAVQVGFVVLTGSDVFVRGRGFPVRLAGRPSTALIHVQIDHRRPLAWTDAQRRETSSAILAMASSLPAKRLQVDFEVRKSERSILLDVLSDLRRIMPQSQALSITALASWCETETWLSSAPVDEIVPMLFRMGPGGEPLKAKLAAGGDFANPRCRTALAISVDTPLARVPPGRRIYVFDPHGWTAADYGVIRQELARWSSSR